MKPITQFDDQEPVNEALLMARIAAEEQGRFARRLVGGMLAFMLLWLLALLFFKQPGLLNLSRMLPGKAQAPATADAAAPVTSQVMQLNQELIQLQQQLGDALTQTLTMKLEALEERIRLGQAGLQDLELLQSIRQDIRMLTKQTSSRAKVAARPAAVLQTQNLLMDKLVRLESLLYLSLASFALITVAAVGYWLRWSARMRRLDADLTRLRYQLEHRRD